MRAHRVHAPCVRSRGPGLSGEALRRRPGRGLTTHGPRQNGFDSVTWKAKAPRISQLTAASSRGPRQVLAELANAQPEAERAAAARVSPEDPRELGRLATRTEMRQPGFLERTLGGGGGSLLGSFAMGFAGSMIANSFFDAMDHGDMAGDPAGEGLGGGGDLGGGDDLGGDVGGDDLGGDLGGDFDV